MDTTSLRSSNVRYIGFFEQDVITTRFHGNAICSSNVQGSYRTRFYCITILNLFQCIRVISNKLKFFVYLVRIHKIL